MSLKEVKSELKRSKDSTKIKLTANEERDLISKYRKAPKITYQKLKTQMSKKDNYFSQPQRVQPSMGVFTADDDYSIAQRIVKMSSKEVRKWGPLIIVDVKVDGCRGLLVIDSKNKEVKIFSRTLKEFKKLEKKYSKDILKRMSKVVKDKTVLDVELCVVGAEGEILPGSTVAGWCKNPQDDKYKNFQANIQAFDLIMLNSKDIRNLPLKYRKRLLEVIIWNFSFKINIRNDGY